MISSEWKKGSRSNGNGGSNCVEAKADLVGPGKVPAVCVRHSRRTGIELVFTPAEWRAFIESVKLGEFDLPQ